MLTLGFFLTPIIYPLSQAPAWARPFLNLNPFTTLAVSYQEVLVVPGPFLGWPRLLVFGRRVDAGVCGRLFRLRSVARHAGGGSVNAIEVRDVRKTYRRYGRRKSFGTLKSAILYWPCRHET